MNSKQAIDEGDLGLTSDRDDSAIKLPLFEHPHNLKTLNGCSRCSHRLEAGRWLDKPFGCSSVTAGAEQKINGFAMLVDGSVMVSLVPFNTHKGPTLSIV
ncbi:hypothetical protein PsAD2_04275 [Pseudovibrio axinellae]|uniref:Uncharacterized protein n=1 Tax=Pseudovibrio axinellae TaxID=989403 RepID=A0A165T2X5_9HYPH|nr:hypothetical protein [Pseudovibrio axinellae]KZL05350.1 hypothetical protein PsAD2_04275 [Pseudovibrio axinellae]SER84683.1 hypothetical protein SAMN05421798_1362 [Pseudovibrio axinellae]